MPDVTATELVESLQREVDGGLRVVAEYDRDGYEVLYVRDDVEDRLAVQADDVHDELVLQGIGREYLEDLFDAGDLHCSAHRFDDLSAFHFIDGEYGGVFVSLDAGVDVPFETFTELCEAYL